MTVHGFDVSKWQPPGSWNWEQLASDYHFLVARATYGARGPHARDPRFAEYMNLSKEYGLSFGAYLFYRQTHGWQEQYDLFRRVVEEAGGLGPGDLLPVLDLETNEPNGDGHPIASKFNFEARHLAEAMREDYGGCILYFSSFFPEHMGARRSESYKWVLQPGYYFWLADYNRPAGQPRAPYTDDWHIHQPKPSPFEVYSAGRYVVDYDIVNPHFALSELQIKEHGDVSEEGAEADEGTLERPGGSFDDEKWEDGLTQIAKGAEMIQNGAELLKQARNLTPNTPPEED